MYSLLIKLMLITTLIQLGWSLKDFSHCPSRACTKRLEKQSREIIKINWKPISVWPEEAKMFK